MESNSASGNIPGDSENLVVTLREKVDKLGALLEEDGLFHKKQVDEADRKRIAEIGKSKIGLPQIFSFSSLDSAADGIYLMARGEREKILVIFYKRGSEPIYRQRFEGELIKRDSWEVLLCPYGHTNASALREAFSYARPCVLGRTPAFGMGYRPSWGWGNIAQALVAKELGLHV